MASDGRNDLLSIEVWRREQQAEWGRLSSTVHRKYHNLCYLSLTQTARSSGHNACSHPFSYSQLTHLKNKNELDSMSDVNQTRELAESIYIS